MFRGDPGSREADVPMKNKETKTLVLRECPTPSGDSQNLITHKVSPAMCLARQAAGYHKCFRCKWRGKPAVAEKAAGA